MTVTHPKLADSIHPTTLIRSSKLNDHLGFDITIASETFQHTGSFKFRAAYNLALNVPQQRILTASSGNFGQALAYACKLLGKHCTVVMPQTSAKVKIEAVRSYGAEVALIDTTKVGRAERVKELMSTFTDTYAASAYDDLHVIEGNATLGDELADKGFEAVIVPVGGGGLISGVITGLRRNASMANIYGAEPRQGNDAARSLHEGRLIANETEPATIADGARTISLGNLNWPIIKKEVREIFEVSEERIKDAVKLFFDLANLKCEPTGALSLGALLENGSRLKGQKVCLIVSGGNVDNDIYRGFI